MNDLMKRLRDYIQREQLFGKKDRLYLAVSGGLDSVVMCHLLIDAGYDIHLLHMNFQLRGDESDRDELFVRELAVRFSIPCSTQRVDAEGYASLHRCSIQEAARELRYAWFEEMRAKDPQQPAWILTAHQQDDNYETSLYHFVLGTGIHGVRGILPKQQKIIRPLLWASRSELLDYALQNNLEWVEDSSNATEKYTRNYLRHQIIPALERVHPGVRENLTANLERFRETEMIYNEAIHRYRDKWMLARGVEYHLPVLAIKKTAARKTILYELLKGYQFYASQLEDILSLLDAENGRYVSSETHRVIKNRNWLILAPINSHMTSPCWIDGPGQWQLPGGLLQIRKRDQLPARWINDPNRSIVPAASLSFPLQCRQWKTGDYFYPFGLRKKKKLARFFIDQKLSTTQKEQQWVLESAGKIIWLPGLRLDDRFRCTGQEDAWMEMSWTPESP